jgi:hypothetical protein
MTPPPVGSTRRTRPPLAASIVLSTIESDALVRSSVERGNDGRAEGAVAFGDGGSGTLGEDSAAVTTRSVRASFASFGVARATVRTQASGATTLIEASAASVNVRPRSARRDRRGSSIERNRRSMREERAIPTATAAASWILDAERAISSRCVA